MSDGQNNHKAFRIRIPDALTSSLDKTEQSAFERHLALCSQCREEYERMKSLFSTLEKTSMVSPPDHYFSNLLPRVRQRLEARRPAVSPMRTLLRSQWALPISALAISLVLISHLSLTNGGDTDGLEAVVGTMTSEELADVLAVQAEREVIASTGAADLLSGAISDRTMLREMFRSVLEDDQAAVFAPLSGLSDLNEGEIDAVLQELKQRSML